MSVVKDYLREVADKDLAAARKLLDRAEVKHDMIFRTGRIAPEIVDAANNGKFDMIVMGSKGRSALKDLLIGSIAQKVIGTSTVPVLLVN
jgi:nucleotide-binding universal stress UspA family protein